MRIPLIAIALSVAFAGCSDPVATGDLASTGHALVVAGAVVDFDAASFSDPSPAAEAQACTGDELPHPPEDTVDDPFAAQRCQHPYTKFTVNFTALPDPLTQSYTLMVDDGSGTRTEIGTISGHVHPTTQAYMAEDFKFDNSDEGGCATATEDAGCFLQGTLQLYLGEVHVASAPMGNGAFELAEGLLGATFSVTYEGKELELTASGLGNYTYEGWLIYTAEDGTVEHAQSFPVANGANTFEAPMDIEEYSGVHIHVKGTKLNVAVGTLA